MQNVGFLMTRLIFSFCFKFSEAFPDMSSLPRLTGALRAFSDLSPDLNDEVSTNENELQRKRHLLAKRRHVKEGSGWLKLVEKVEKESTADKNEVKQGFKELLQCARQIGESNKSVLLSSSEAESDLLSVRVTISNMSRVMRKSDFCTCKNKDTDQLRGNREADQRLCFPYTDSNLLPKSKISSL